MNKYTQYFKRISDHKLVTIIDNPMDYDVEAVKTAKVELVDRGITEEEIDDIRVALMDKALDHQEKMEQLQAVDGQLGKIQDFLNPFQPKPIRDWLKIIASLLILLNLYTIYSSFDGLTQYYWVFQNEGLSLHSMVYGIGILGNVVFLFGSFQLWNSKPIGWKIVTVILTIQLLTFLNSGYSYFAYRSLDGEFLLLLLVMVLLVGVLRYLNKAAVLDFIGITQKTQSWCLGIGASYGLLMMVWYWI